MNIDIKKAWRLPWRMNNAPHAVLDIVRGCNIQCRSCYNDNVQSYFKSLDEIKSDFQKICQFRKISSVGLIGGEPLLHPEIIEVIRFLKSKNLDVEIFTNGLLLDEKKSQELATAGVDLIFMHIDIGQKRLDLPENYTLTQLNILREEKARLVRKAGMEAAMSVTLHQQDIDRSTLFVKYFRESPHMSYFLMTLYRHMESIGPLKGDLSSNITSTRMSVARHDDEPDINDVVTLLKEKIDLTPYAFIGGKINADKPRWVTYLIPAAFSKDNRYKDSFAMRHSLVEKKYLDIQYQKNGVYPFYSRQNSTMARGMLFLNALLGGYFFKNLLFLSNNFCSRILLKRLLIQFPAMLLENGQVEHCACCPDLTVKGGALVPVCMADNFNRS
ncbi:MAG: radical SAM protein [Candidatus Omnitrophica bacterium]|nr:radical SAM protein [Candidatus Omnitrophota bacterium]